MSVDPKVGSMIPEDLSTKCSIGSIGGELYESVGVE